MSEPKNLEAVIDTIADAIVDVEKSLADDGQLNFADLPKFYNLVGDVGPMLAAIPGIPSDIQMLTLADALPLQPLAVGEATQH